MSNTYKWIIKSLDCNESEHGKSNVVFNINWILEATDDLNTIPHNDFTVITYNEENFTPFESLLEEQITGWITNSLGEEKINEIKSILDQRLINLRIPPIVTKIPPWVVPVE